MMDDYSTPYHSIASPPRKRQRISVWKPIVNAAEFNIRDSYFHKKRVRFAVGEGVTFETVNEPTNCDSTTKCFSETISEKERKRCWYDRSDLMTFRQEALSDAFAKLNKSNGDETSLPRGMESLAPIRRKHKANALRYILLAHRIGKDHNFVGRLCTKLARWNTDIAIHSARLDYLEIYQPSSIHTVPPVLSRPPNIPLVPNSVAKVMLSQRSKIEATSFPPSPARKKRERSYSVSECPIDQSSA